MRIDYDLLTEVEEELNTKYEQINMKEEDKTVLLTSDEIENMINDLLIRIVELKTIIEDIENDKEENYKRIAICDQVE